MIHRPCRTSCTHKVSSSSRLFASCLGPHRSGPHPGVIAFAPLHHTLYFFRYVSVPRRAGGVCVPASCRRWRLCGSASGLTRRGGSLLRAACRTALTDNSSSGLAEALRLLECIWYPSWTWPSSKMLGAAHFRQRAPALLLLLVALSLLAPSASFAPSGCSFSWFTARRQCLSSRAVEGPSSRTAAEVQRRGQDRDAGGAGRRFSQPLADAGIST